MDLQLNGTWECEPVVQLVVIGTQLECEGTLAALNECIADHDGAGSVAEAAQREAEAFEGMVRGDGFFEAAGREGCLVTFGLRESLEMRLQGIYATDLNSELIAFVNSCPTSVLAYPSTDEGTGKVQTNPESSGLDTRRSINSHSAPTTPSAWSRLFPRRTPEPELSQHVSHLPSMRCADRRVTLQVLVQVILGKGQTAGATWQVVRDSGSAVLQSKPVSCRCGF